MNETNQQIPTNEQGQEVYKPTPNWVQEELDELGEGMHEYEYMNFEEGVATAIEIDMNQPFKEIYNDRYKVKKAIIMVKHGGKECSWLLNKRNPTYRQILEFVSQEKTKLVITKSGQGIDLKYKVDAQS